MRGPSGFSVAGLGELGRVTNESRLKHDPIRSPGAWFAFSVLEPNSEIGDGAFRDLGRGAMLYILRSGRMTASSTRPHRTGSDSTRIQIRPSGKCVINCFYTVQPVQEGTESNGYRGTGPGERFGSVNERSSHHRVVSGQLHDAQTPANRPLPHV